MEKKVKNTYLQMFYGKIVNIIATKKRKFNFENANGELPGKFKT